MHHSKEQALFNHVSSCLKQILLHYVGKLPFYINVLSAYWQVINWTLYNLQRKRAEDGEILSDSDSENEAPKKKRGRKKRERDASSDSEPEYDSDGNLKKKRGRYEK